MKINFIIFFFSLAISLSVQAQIFVSPSGNDTTGTGSIDFPYRTIPKAILLAVPGDTIHLRGGIHSYSTKISISSNGTANSMYHLFAYYGEKPVIDFSAIGGTSTDGFSLNGSFWYFKGLEIRKAPHNGIKISAGSNNIIEHCSFHNCGNTGFQLGSSSSTAPYPSNNLILNCDAYFNFDPPVGGNADGFGIKWNVGAGNVFKGCRAYNNSDDGFDLWMCLGSITIDSCWAFRNGVDIWHTGSVNGNGNGFKLGGNYVATPNTVRNCLAFDNFSKGSGGKGFDENNNMAGQTIYNCTSFRNAFPNFSFPNNPLTSGSHIIKNCISFVGLMPDTIVNAIHDHNSWNGLIVSNSDFISLDTVQAVAPRNAAGGLPVITLMHLTAGSSLVDAGIDVGLPFNGLAPDLGAFENQGTNEIKDNQSVVREFSLYQNYPNPFNPSTKLSFSLANGGFTMLKVYNILGKEIATLFSGDAEAGELYEFTFDVPNLSNGLYFYKLQNGNNVEIKKMILIK